MSSDKDIFFCGLFYAMFVDYLYILCYLYNRGGRMKYDIISVIKNAFALNEMKELSEFEERVIEKIQDLSEPELDGLRFVDIEDAGKRSIVLENRLGNHFRLIINDKFVTLDDMENSILSIRFDVGEYWACYYFNYVYGDDIVSIFNKKDSNTIHIEVYLNAALDDSIPKKNLIPMELVPDFQESFGAKSGYSYGSRYILEDYTWLGTSKYVIEDKFSYEWRIVAKKLIDDYRYKHIEEIGPKSR